MVAVAKLNAEPTLKNVAKKALRQERRAEDYVGIVRKVAYAMARRLPSRIDVRDLMSAGTIGLLDALVKYDAAQNDNFEAYAEIRIRGAILDELRSLDWVPRSVRQKSNGLEKTTRALESELGRTASEDEIAKAMSISVDELHGLVNETRTVTVVSVEDILGGGGNLGANDVSEECALASLCKQADSAELATALEQLSERPRLVLSLYYLEGLKLKEIGSILGVTESRVCQIHAQAIKSLKKILAV